MNEANNNAPSFDSKSNVEFNSAIDGKQQQQNEVDGVSTGSPLESSRLASEPMTHQEQLAERNTAAEAESGEQKMNWQKVAHKLREYNRKLLKKVFRLEQDLAEVENKFNKQIDKARSSDLLVAQQAEEIKIYQEKIAQFERKSDCQLAEFKQLIKEQKSTIDNLTQQYESSQQQTASIERDCVALQENYNDKIYELATKEQKIKDLKAKLSQQQRYAMQYKAELQRYEEQIARATKVETASQNSKNLQQRSIKPWSIPANSEPKIALPQTKIQPARIKQSVKASKTVKTAAQIATWKASEVSSPKRSKSQAKKQSSTSKKPQSLAAVDLPTFPRHSNSI